MLRVSLILSLLLAAALPLFAADPSEQFLSAYQSYQDGENLERQGNTSDALSKYRFAESLLLAITKNDPSWQKPVIEYRLKKTRGAIDRLQGVFPDTGGADATLATPPAVESTPVPSAPSERAPSREPSISITPPTSTPGSSASALVPRATAPPSQTSSAEMRRLRKTIEDLRGELQEANDALGAQKSRASDLENAQWAKQRSQLSNDLDVANRKISDLEHDLKARDSWGDQLKDLQKKLDDAVADKLATEEQYQGSVKKLGDENATLAKQLSEAHSKIVTSENSKKQIEQLNQEVEQGKEAYAQLQAKLDHSEEISKVTLAKNDDLQKQLTETTEKLVVAQKQAELSAPLHEKLKELQAKVDQENSALSNQASLQADVAVLQEDRNRLMQKVTALGAAAAESSKVQGLTAETEMMKKTVADLKGALEASNQELIKARAEATDSKKVAAASDKAANQAKDQLAKNINDRDADQAVLQEEKERLLAKVARASLLLDSLKATADTVPLLRQNVGQLKGQLLDTSNALDQSAKKIAEAKLEESSLRKELQSKGASSKNIADLMSQQNKALQEQLKTALAKVASTVDQASESSALQDQVKKLQEQMDHNAHDFAESQRQLAEIAKTQPDQQKALEEKQKALAEAQTQAADLRTQLADAGKQITTLKQQGDQGQARLKALQGQLEERDAKIASLNKNKGNPADEQIVQENELLRGIVLREIKDEAKKSQAHRLMEEELKRLNVQSDVLTQQMGQLSAPAVELTPQERGLFKDAQLVVSDQGGERVEASIAAPMRNIGSNSAVVDKGSTNSTVTQGEKQGATNADTGIPWQGKFKELLGQAKEEFDRQDYLEAENSFQQALKLSPSDYFALSNYGVVEFQLGKMKEAEEALERATDQTNSSSFALTTLGIVHYRQQRPEEAEAVLRKAVAINDQDFTAHNYLGIVLAASGKGKAGESELMKAVEINPNYADAHFNLAVIYATGKPPAKALAKKHYQKALDLGSPPDPSLDHILQ